MKNYETLMALVNAINVQEDAEDLALFISQRLEKITAYHSFVINYAVQTEIQKHRLEGQDFIDYMESMNDKRITHHKAMIDAIIQVNRFCKAEGINPIYDGKIDETKRYDDADTRFGIAEWADEFCSEVYRISVKDHKAVVEKENN